MFEGGFSFAIARMRVARQTVVTDSVGGKPWEIIGQFVWAAFI
jgi:hypothetical protein